VPSCPQCMEGDAFAPHSRSVLHDSLPEPVVRTPLGLHRLQVRVIQEEAPLQLRTGRRPVKRPVPGCLLIRREPRTEQDGPPGQVLSAEAGGQPRPLSRAAASEPALSPAVRQVAVVGCGGCGRCANVSSRTRAPGRPALPHHIVPGRHQPRRADTDPRSSAAGALGRQVQSCLGLPGSFVGEDFRLACLDGVENCVAIVAGVLLGAVTWRAM
jgi:hypothetical protein